MKFVDLNTGYLYDGESPYIHWFSGEQSTGLIYDHKICLISKSKTINISLDSDVFNIVDNSSIKEGVEYKKIIQQNITSTSEQYNGYNLHIIYFTASSKVPGEYTTDVCIEDGEEKIYITIGADFYMENESLYINLSNLGVELPDAIQKALYTVNIDECNRDNITLNRKMKELLSNYWDMIANKGSYKSLLNTLKWFEWGDLIRIREIWKHEDFGHTIYDDRSLCSILEDKYIDTLNNFSKTTHLALYVTMQKLSDGDNYDDEKNPELEEVIIDKWGKNELMLKLCLLGNFYETYFMPIHLNLFHSTIENVVFTNTIKIINSNISGRYDYVNNIDTIACNVKNDSTYILSNVQCQVGPNTVFGKQWEGESQYKDIHIIGVDYVNTDKFDSDNDMKTFYSQLFKGVGVIVPFECIMDAEINDYIAESKLYINDHYTINHNIFHSQEIDGKSKFKINFNLLFRTENKYNITIQFKTAGSKLYTKTININVVDVSGMDLKVYKIKHYNYLTESYIEFMKDFDINNFMFKRYKENENNMFYTQYIPTTSNIRTSGVCLNHILVLKGDYLNDGLLTRFYYTTFKSNETSKYTICVSKYFWFDPNKSILDFKNQYLPYVYRSDYGYFPEFHYLEEMVSDKESYYNINNEDVIAVIPELPLGLKIDSWDWEFINVSTGKTIKLPNYQEPYVNNLTKELLDKGYYDVIFKYKIGNTEHTLTRKSIFKKL